MAYPRGGKDVFISGDTPAGSSTGLTAAPIDDLTGGQGELGLVGPARIFAKMLEQEVDETAYFCREMAAMWIDRIDCQLACPKVRQDRNEMPGFEIIRN